MLKNIILYIYIYSKEIGKQSSELRVTFTCNNTLNEGWCETLPHIRIHLMKGGVRLWCATLHHIRIHFMKGGVRLWCETLHQGWPRVWGGSRSTNPCVFPCKVASAGDERYLLCAAVAAAVVLVPPLCSATSGCSCAHSSLCFLKLWLQIALEWLHECCMGYVLGRKPDQETF